MRYGTSSEVRSGRNGERGRNDSLLSFTTVAETVIKRFAVNARTGQIDGIYRLKVAGNTVDEIFAGVKGAYARDEADGIVKVASGVAVLVTLEQGTIGAASVSIGGTVKGGDDQD